MQDAGARRVSNADGIRRMVRKHDCALLAQYTKHSNARGHSLGLGLGLGSGLGLALALGLGGGYFLRLHTPFSIGG